MKEGRTKRHTQIESRTQTQTALFQLQSRCWTSFRNCYNIYIVWIIYLFVDFKIFLSGFYISELVGQF